MTTMTLHSSILALIAILGVSLNSCKEKEAHESFDGMTICDVEIRYQVPPEIDEERLKNFIKITKGDIYTVQSIDEDIKSIYESGLVNDVRVLVEPRDGVLLVVYEVQTRQGFGPGPCFVGNTSSSDTRLAKESGLKAFDPFTEDQRDQVIQRLTQFYKANGFKNVEITARPRSHDSEPLDFIFLVDEGLASELEPNGPLKSTN